MINWIIENYKDICVWVTTIVACASTIVKLTPTTKDDSILEKIIEILSLFSIFNTKKDQKIIDENK